MTLSNIGFVTLGWLSLSPEYTTRGITFEVLCLDVEAPNTQTVCFAPEESFVLLDNHCVMPSEYPNRFRVIAVCEEEVIVRHEAQ
ncbi:MAG: hypothetical protein PUP92_13030 [Rhizonema sp. PD38]|nr:hypothetical protein [Rhizonema sp. PD38]